MAVYRAHQREYLARHHKRDNRRPSEHRLMLLDFVSERRHKGIAWPTVLKQWNAFQPGHKYKPTSIGNFRRDFNDTYDLVVGLGRAGKRPREYRYADAIAQMSTGAEPAASLIRNRRRGNDKTPPRPRTPR